MCHDVTIQLTGKVEEDEDGMLVQVISIQEMGAYVHLLEYDNTEGMILLSELSRRRIRSINKLIKARNRLLDCSMSTA